jgi:thiamine-monophosphate kinase
MNLDEFGLIHHLAAKLPPEVRQSADVVVGIGDDTAVVKLSADAEGLLTTDTMVEGVHFRSDTMTMRDVGYKCVLASISDIAAMGGRPRHVLLSLAVPKQTETAQLEALYEGIGEVCRAYGCTVVGGDVVGTSGPLVITSTVTGMVPQGTALLRSGAKPGDLVFTTGTLGDSAAGLAVLRGEGFLPSEEAVHLISTHQRPLAQVSAGDILRRAGASSCNDVSDGLASELNEIAKASGVRLRIDAHRIPISPAVKSLAKGLQTDALDYAWYGGEDYQLVGTANSFAYARAIAHCEVIGVRLVQIGRVEPGDGVIATLPDGTLSLVEAKGYNHFRD